MYTYMECLGFIVVMFLIVMSQRTLVIMIEGDFFECHLIHHLRNIIYTVLFGKIEPPFRIS